MGVPAARRWVGALAGLPRSLLKQFIVHFEPTGALLPGGPPDGLPLPFLSLQEARSLALYRLHQWFVPQKPTEGPPHSPPMEGATGRPLDIKPPAVWPSVVPLPEGPPPPHAAEVPEGLLRVQAIGHGSFLLQTRGPPQGGPWGPISILVDPFFSRRAGPWGQIGGKQQQQQQQQQHHQKQQQQQQQYGVAWERQQKRVSLWLLKGPPVSCGPGLPGVSIASLPPIDVVLLTSCSYDTMDVGALLELHALFSPVLVGPRGALGPLYLPSKLRGSAYPLQWGEGPLQLGGALFSLLPAASGAPSRFGLDKGIGGWGAFCVTLGPHQVFVGGAQGFSPPLLRFAGAAAQQQRLFAALQQQDADIRDKYEARWGPLEADDPTSEARAMAAELAAARQSLLQQQQQRQQQQQEQQQQQGTPGAFDVALIPMGGYEPASLLQRFHMTPEEAVEAHRLLGSRVSVASRYDVLPIGGEPYGEAPLRAQAACAKQGLPFNPHHGGPPTAGGPPTSGAPPDDPAASGGPPRAPQGFYALQPGEALYVESAGAP
ncbi:hypothetical protein ACSSS7_000164 [Eimeria intestinalis]